MVSPTPPQERLFNLLHHLNGPLSEEGEKELSSDPLPPTPRRNNFAQHTQDLQLYGKKERSFPVINALLMEPRLYDQLTPIELLREHTSKQLKQIAASGVITGEKVAHHFHTEEMQEIVAKIGLLGGGLATLLWVHFALWSVSILRIGTEKHQHLIDQSNRLDFLGCCMMTEDGYGSDVASQETTATWIPHQRQYLLTTPSTRARKIWSGGLAERAEYGVVFARLLKPHSKTQEVEDYGPHAFVVKIRDQGKIRPGLIIGEMGKWLGRDHTGRLYLLTQSNDQRLYNAPGVWKASQEQNRDPRYLYDLAQMKCPHLARKYRTLLYETSESAQNCVPLDTLPTELGDALARGEEGKGAKLGLNDVDNGWVLFNDFPLEEEAFLDRYTGQPPHRAKKLIYSFMSQFVRGRQIISITSTTGTRLLTQLLYAFPPAQISQSRHRQEVVHLASLAYALEASRPLYLSQENVDAHIPASAMKALSSWMLFRSLHHLLDLYGSHPHTSRVSFLLQEFLNAHTATTIYEGANSALLQMVGKEAFETLCPKPEWMTAMAQMTGKKLPQLLEWVEEIRSVDLETEEGQNRLSTIQDPCQRGLFLLRWRALQRAKKMGDQLFPAIEKVVGEGKPPKEVAAHAEEVWKLQCAQQAHLLAMEATQVQVIESMLSSLSQEQEPELYHLLATHYVEHVLLHPLLFDESCQPSSLHLFPPEGPLHTPIPMNPKEARERYESEEQLRKKAPQLAAKNGWPTHYLEPFFPSREDAQSYDEHGPSSPQTWADWEMEARETWLKA